MPTSATLSGPTSGMGGVPSTNFTVTLDSAAGPGGVSVAITSTVGGDTITSTPLMIPNGSTTGTFTLTPSTIGNRDISITTTPALTIIGSPITYTATGNCPDDAAATARSQTWTSAGATCPPTFSITFGVTPSTLEAKDLYCTTGALSLTLTE